MKRNHGRESYSRERFLRQEQYSKKHLFFLYYKSQLVERLDHWSYRIISLGFIFLSIGILSGAVWANETGIEIQKKLEHLLFEPYSQFIYTHEQKKFIGVNFAIVASICFFIFFSPTNMKSHASY